MNNAVKQESRYRGSPVRLPSVPADCDPFAGLELITGLEDSDPSIRRLAESGLDEQQKSLDRTIIIPPFSMCNNDPDAIMSQLSAGVLRVPKLPSEDPDPRFLIMAQDGTQLCAGHPDYWGDEVVLQELAVTTPELLTDLKIFRDKTIELSDIHQEVLMSLLGLPQGGLIFETGAGADFSRIRAFDAYAKTKKGRLVCHDLLPASARMAAEETTGIPYLALVNFPRHLPEPIKAAARPVFITLKDVVSSMSASTVLDLLKTAASSAALKVVITQSLGLADGSDIYPDDIKPDTSKAVNMLQVAISLDPARPREQLETIEMLVALKQALHTYRLIMFEILMRYVEASARSAEYQYNSARRLVVNTEKKLEPDQAKDYIENFYPHMIMGFENGHFNTVNFGPFEVHFGHSAGVAQGQLKVCSRQVHLVLSKNETGFPKPSFRGVDIQQIKPHLYYASSSQRYLSPQTLLHHLIAGSLATTTSPQELLPQIQASHSDLVPWGAKIGLRFVRDVVFTQYPHRIPNSLMNWTSITDHFTRMPN